MKLESTLTDRAGLLYTAPLMDVILLLLIFFLFGSNLVLKSGVEVNLPASSSVLPSAEDAHLVTLLPNDSGGFFFNDRRVDLPELSASLGEAGKRSKQVVILGDESIDFGVVMEVANLFLREGFEVSFATKVDSP